MSAVPIIGTIGSLTFDLFVHPQDVTVMRFCRETQGDEEYMALPYGGKTRVESVHEDYGGGAQNTAVGLTRLGVSAAPIGQIGTDTWGNSILAHLEQEGVSQAFVQKTEREQTGFSVILNSFEGERTVLAHAGANSTLKTIPAELLATCDGFFFNHISSTGENADHVFLQIKRHFLAFPEKFLAWNPGQEQLQQGAMAFADFFPVVDLLLLNREEAELFSGRRAQNRRPNISSGAAPEFPQSAADYSDIFRVFVRQGARNVVITDGRHGAQLCDGKQLFFCGIDETQPRVDTLGAGDAFGSALFYGLFTHKELLFALKCASINAASVVSHIGAQAGLLDATELLKRAQTSRIPTLQQSFSL